MKRTLLLLFCSSPVLLNGMANINIKQNTLEIAEILLTEELLAESVENNDINTVQTLLIEKVNLDKVLLTKLLFSAIIKQNIDMVKILVAAGANMNEIKDDYTPLMLALSHTQGEIAKFLIDAGANIAAKNSRNCTALYYAITNGQDDIAQLLISKGADLSKALIPAIRWKRINIIKILIDVHADINTKADSYIGYITPALIYAIEQNYPEIATMLIDAGADIHAKETKKNNPLYSKTALYYALTKGLAEVVQLLIAKGADIDQIKDIVFATIPNKLAILQAIEKGKKERQAQLEAQKNLEEKKIYETQEEKKSEIFHTSYNDITFHFDDQLSANESPQFPRNKAPKKHCIVM